MHLLIPSDIYDRRSPDPVFAAEAEAAKTVGFTVVLFHLESLKEGNLNRALATIETATEPDTPLLHRGWILNEDEYTNLYNALRD